MMSPTPMEEENYKLLKIQMQLKINEWDLYIYRLKKTAPVSDADLEEMWTRRLEVRKVIESVQNSLPESTLATRRPFKLKFRKLLDDYNDIYENFTEEEEADSLEDHSDSKDLETAKTSPDEQLPHPVIANKEAIATKSQKKRKKHQRQYLLKPTPRPTKLTKATMMKILLRRKTVLNRVRNLLDPARRPQCHPFPVEGRVKSGLHKCTQQQPVSGINRQLPRRRHLTPSGSHRQSTASSSRLSTTKTGEAVSGDTSILYNEDKLYNSAFSVKDKYTKIPRADAVQVWLFHDHYI